MPERRSCSGNRNRSDTRADERIAAAATDCWGVFSVQELLAYGLSRQGVMRRQRAGTLHRRYPGTYALGYALDLPEARMLAAVKAGGDEVLLSHRTAAWLWRFLEGDEPKPEITIPRRGLRAIEGITIH